MNLPYLPFSSAAGPADISFHYLYSPLPSLHQAELVFDSGGSYRLYRQQEKYLVALGKEPCTRSAAFDLGFTKGEVYILPPAAGGPPCPLTLHLFEHPLDQLALVNYLAQGRGALLHACGVVHENQGWLFVGMSGAGKSTIAKIWQAAGAPLLGDDRIAVRGRHGSFHIYGTPWPGEVGISSPDSAPLKNIFFLEKAPRHFLRPLPPMEAVTRLVGCSFPPLYHKPSMAFILDFFSQLVATTPCYELGFVPEAGVLNFLRAGV